MARPAVSGGFLRRVIVTCVSDLGATERPPLHQSKAAGSGSWWARGREKRERAKRQKEAMESLQEATCSCFLTLISSRFHKLGVSSARTLITVIMTHAPRERTRQREKESQTSFRLPFWVTRKLNQPWADICLRRTPSDHLLTRTRMQRPFLKRRLLRVYHLHFRGLITLDISVSAHLVTSQVFRKTIKHLKREPRQDPLKEYQLQENILKFYHLKLYCFVSRYCLKEYSAASSFIVLNPSGLWH